MQQMKSIVKCEFATYGGFRLRPMEINRANLSTMNSKHITTTTNTLYNGFMYVTLLEYVAIYSVMSSNNLKVL